MKRSCSEEREVRKGDAGDDVQLILPPKKPKTDEELEKESSPRKDSGQVDVVPGTEQKVEAAEELGKENVPSREGSDSERKVSGGADGDSERKVPEEVEVRVLAESEMTKKEIKKMPAIPFAEEASESMETSIIAREAIEVVESSAKVESPEKPGDPLEAEQPVEAEVIKDAYKAVEEDDDDLIVLDEPKEQHVSPAESSAPSEEKRETKSSKELRDAGKQGVQSRRRSAAKEEKERIAEEKRRSFEEKKREKERQAEEKRLKMEERQREKEEQRRLREEEKRQKEQRRREREEMKEKKRQEEEERRKRKRKEEEEKLEKRKAEEEERRRKEEEKRKKEEEKRKKEEERRKKEEAEKLKKKRESEHFLSFFSKEEREKREKPQPQPFLFSSVLPFYCKENVTLAPEQRRDPLTPELYQNLLNIPPPEKPYLSTLPLRPRGKVKPMRSKLFQFEENRRPAYFGTWRKRSKVITARRPFARDSELLEYEYDSDEDWESEFGDDCEHTGDEDEEESEDSDDAGFVVQHGYLSEGEGETESGDEEEKKKEADPHRKERLKVLADEWEEHLQQRRQVAKKLEPVLYGPTYDKMELIPAQPAVFFRYEDEATQLVDHLACLIDLNRLT